MSNGRLYFMVINVFRLLLILSVLAIALTKTRGKGGFASY